MTPEAKEIGMTEDQITHMVNRFLAWKLPQDFNPDGGITFKREFNENTAHPMKHEPSGTNLLAATQAREMIRHMLEEIEAETPEDQLYRVSVATGEGITGWDAYVIARSLGEAVELATDVKPYRVDQPLSITALRALRRDD
jgi:hypothetical protein